MYEGNSVGLRMEKMIAVDGIFDDATHYCQVFKYDNEEDYIYFLLKDENLTALSLDAKYQCYISAKNELLNCTGTIKERYQCKYGNIAVFKIEDGFYTTPAASNFFNR